ncbi:RNA polymerase sigma factor [Massilia horti]|uniref:RNA polymerase sigma factor n=1 Tax=Massilia horti TaxID=2562153 RepID=UPI001E5B633B|nr:RNA polymerase sigma factor [Massilia horti]
MTEPDDNQLLRAIRQGDAAAFQSLYWRHRSGLYSFALLHCGAPDVAADVVQDVFMGLLNDSYAFDPLRGMLANFLYGVARNLVLRHARQNERWVQPDEDEDGDSVVEPVNEAAGPLAKVLDIEATEHLQRALSQLAPHYRDVLILFELHELSYQEIAGICQLEIGTVRSRLSRGRAALSKALTPYRALDLNTA